MSHSSSGADLGGWQPPHLPLCIGQSELLHLSERQFDRRRPAVNAHLNFEQRVLVVNLLDGPMERRKRTIRDAHKLAHFEGRRPHIEWHRRLHSFSTCPNSSSPGAGRPNILTAALMHERASSTSSPVPLKDANGPSETRTCSPTSKETDGFGRSMPSCT